MSRKTFWKNLRRDRQLVFMLIPVVIFFAVFSYYPLYGILIAFKDYSISKGILGSPWAGLRYFRQFFLSPYFGRLLRNTVLISVYSLLWGFPVPILFALLLNEFKDGKFKRLIQTVSYLPHFISLVVICGILIDIFSPQGGVVNALLYSLTGKRINFFGEPEWFRAMYVGSGVWQEFGWNSIIIWPRSRASIRICMKRRGSTGPEAEADLARHPAGDQADDPDPSDPESG